MGCPAYDDDEEAMTTVFHRGDRVQLTCFDKTHLATIHSVPSPGIIYVVRDDGVTGSGPDNSYIAYTTQLMLLSRPAAFTGFPTSAPEEKDKGYKPDGFNADAHRDYMRNFGG